MNKTQKITLGLTAISLAVLPLVAFAQLGGMEGGSTSIQSISIGIANAVWVVFTVIAVICFIVAGILFLTAYGDSTKLATARSSFIWGIVGIIVALLAFGAISLVKNIIGAS